MEECIARDSYVDLLVMNPESLPLLDPPVEFKIIGCENG